MGKKYKFKLLVNLALLGAFFLLVKNPGMECL